METQEQEAAEPMQWTNATVETVEEETAVAAPENELAIIRRIRGGVSFAEFQRLIDILGLTVKEAARVLGITERTMARRMVENGNLDLIESERQVLLSNLVAHGIDVFEDQGKFNRWMRRPLGLLGGESPLEFLNTATSFQVVEQLLGRLEHGVYS